MLKNISIKTKLMYLLSSAVAGCIIFTLLIYSSISNTDSYGHIKVSVEKLKSDMLMLRRNEKDFILRNDMKYKKSFEKNFEILQKDASSLKNDLETNNLESKKVADFINIVKEYKNRLFRYIELQKTIGLNQNDGLTGEMEKAFKQLLISVKSDEDKTLPASLYQTREMERDFLMTNDIKFADSFKKGIKYFTNSPNDKIKQLSKKYENSFLKLADAKTRLGLSHKTGLQGNLRKTIHQTETLLKEFNKEIESQAQEKINSILNITLSLALFLIFLTFFSFIMISKGIVSSITKFQKGLLDFFKYLNKEINKPEILDESAKDEIGHMAQIINKNIKKVSKGIEEDRILIDDVQSVMNGVTNCCFSGRITAHTGNQALEELRDTINHALENLYSRIMSINDTIEVYANLDYRSSLTIQNINPTGVFYQMLINIGTLRDAINEMLVENKSNGLTLDKSSDILMENVNILSKSSNEAAASLEETSAAIDNITSNISKSTDNVVQMAKYAAEVTASASRGNELATETTKAMDDINNEVNAINEAISVIDQITFQTNILSLNAAVEAATAGEAGKGFAVVAGEVRNLASRSAEAANEIKSLVENATTKANRGKKISDEMIIGYTSLNNNINKTIELINEVEQASKKQLIGIEQINNAVITIDKQTQQNAHVASQTYDIAMQTDKIAKLIVSNANAKEFEGKETVQAKSLEISKKED